MRKLLTFLLILWAVCGFAAAPLSKCLYDETGGPSSPLLEVLKVYGVAHEGSWESIVKETQKKWLRQSGKERWEVAEVHSVDHFDLFTKIHMTKIRCPEYACYDYGVILGATAARVIERIQFLITIWNEGVRFNEIVFLTGDRVLTEEEEAYLKGSICKNETEMMRFLYSYLPIPEELRQVKLVIVDTPQNEGKRPNTKETFLQWLKSGPKTGCALIISDQPFLGRADTIARNILSDFTVETVGKGISHEYYLKEKRATPILLDELARWIFEEQAQIKRYSGAS